MKRTIYVAMVCCLVACVESDLWKEKLDGGELPIVVSSTYPSVNALTRAAIDGGFVAGDAMGIFVVDYDAEGNPGEVKMQGNRASNLKFTLQEDGTWQAAAQLYWADQQTPADFYGYYPFDDNMASTSDYSFAITANQSGDNGTLMAAGYAASDLLRAKATKVQPTAETVNLQYQHLMAGVKILLEKGDGFADQEWANFAKTVILQNTVLAGTVNLEDGTVTVGEGRPQSIVPLAYGGTWRGIVFPQTIQAGKTVATVTVDGQSYNLNTEKDIDFVSGKMHQFTIMVNRRTGTGQFVFSLADEAVLPWTDDDHLHEGLVREYTIADVELLGSLESTLAAMGVDWETLENLKVVGTISSRDLDFLSAMPSLINLNLLQVQIEDSIFRGFYQTKIQHLVMPEKGVKTIAGNTLQGAVNLRGTLIIPEGVEEIGWGFCLDAKSMTTVPRLPSTMKRCGAFFQYSNVTGDFQLPDGIEEWEGGLSEVTGEMYLPSSLKKLGQMPPKLTGTIIVPQGCSLSDGTFEHSQCTSVVLPEGLTDVPGYCFRSSQVSGELVLPSTLTHLGGHAFAYTKINKVIFPDALKIMEDGGDDDGPFNHCDRLMGTLELPKNVVRIPKGCFAYCPGITGLVIPAGTMILDENCFRECSGIGSIVCEAEEPPLICTNAFLGVAKDNFTVEVPKGCVDKYRNAQGWSDFKRISEYSNFVCRPAHACALNTAHLEELVLNADDSWTVSDKPDWVTLSRTSGAGKTVLSLTFTPLPHGNGNRTGTITFKMGGYETTCQVSQYDYEYEEDGYLSLQTATKGNGIDIVFVGDGWDGQTISDNSYLDLVKYQMDCFFAIEPYRSMRDYFNVYVTFPLSQEQGVNTMYTYVNNHFGTLQGSFDSPGCTSAQLITESDEVFEYVAGKTPVEGGNLWRTLVILVPNSSVYEGNTQLDWTWKTLSICPPSERAYPKDTRGTVQHEAGGHGFGKLGDETILNNRFVPPTIKAQIEDMHNRDWYANLSTTGKLNSVPWAEFIFDPDYSDRVDVYEGGYGYTRGIYRPEANSCMNYGIPYYNTPSRLAIWKRIKEYAGESWSMEEFRAQDTFDWGPTTVTRSPDDIQPGQGYAESNRHHAPAVVDFKKMGSEVRAIRERLRKQANEK